MLHPYISEFFHAKRDVISTDGQLLKSKQVMKSCQDAARQSTNLLRKFLMIIISATAAINTIK